MTSTAEIVFWLCVAGMVHTYVTYPLSLRLMRRRFVAPPDFAAGAWPSVALLIPAYNEEAVIKRKIENALALDYEAGKFKVLVGNDGSSDRTGAIGRAIQDERLTVVDLPGRSGKSGVYNRLVEIADAEIIVFSDANVMLDSGALRKLIRHFADRNVGVAGGAKYIVLPEGARALRGEVIYGNIENKLRAWESGVGGMSGALGSLMAVRRSLYQPYAPGSLNDDTVPCIWATLAGKRSVYDLEAKAFEESGRTVAEEFHRRVRIGAGNYQTLFRYLRILNPRYGIAAYTYFSHKALRWVFPFLMIGALIANAVLVQPPLYRLTLTAQGAGYSLSLLGFLLNQIGLRIPGLTTLYHFVSLNIGLLGGFIRYVSGIRSSAWEPTAR